MDKRPEIYNNLAMLFDAGMPILRSLKTAGSDIKAPLATDLHTLAEEIEIGTPMPQALKTLDAFKPFDKTMLNLGHKAGELPQACRLLSEWYSFSRKIKRLFISAMVMPVMVFHVAAFIIPLPSLLFGVTKFGGYLFGVFLSLAFFYLPFISTYVFYKLFSTDKLRLTLDLALLKIPTLSTGLYNLALSKYCRAFYMLYSAGLPITDCTKTAADFTGNLAVKAQLIGAAASTARGNSAYEGLSDKLPPEFISAWHNGEESGNLDKATLRLADHHAELAELKIQIFSNWIPKIIYFAIMITLAVNIITRYSQIRMQTVGF
jgi:type II secretory pathway component PulF